MADLNKQLEQRLDSQLYQATCKGVSRMTGNSMQITFEKDGKTFDLDLIGSDSGLHGGLDAILRERKL